MMKFILMIMVVAVQLLLTRSLGAQLQLENAFPSLSFNLAVDLQNAGDGSDRLFAVEQPGTIRVFKNDPTAAASPIFLDIRDRVLSNDRFGLLGLVFHPDYSQNGYFYIHYNAAGPDRSVIARFTESAADSNLADPNSELVLLEVNQPHRFHNGGQLVFGPDGYLYIAFGDGGPVGGPPDPNGHGQNRRTLLGCMLRIDVDNPAGGLNYGIPEDNPFAGNTDGFREEIWAWGFRNPWRFSFDPVTGRLWAGENGENLYEEIDVIEKGKNYGWKTMEGAHCFFPISGCNTTGLELPVWEYGGNNLRRSVIGGYVYRGSNNPELIGKYIYADFLLGRVWSLEYDGSNPAVNTQLLSGFQGIATFGLDEDGEIYLSNIQDGRIYRLAPTITSVTTGNRSVRSFELEQNYPNPFNPSTTINYALPAQVHATLIIYDLLGNEIKTLVSGPQTGGAHSEMWDGRNNVGETVASGIYIYRLTAGQFASSKRLLFLK